MAAEGSVGNMPVAASFVVGNCTEVGKHDDVNSEVSCSTNGIGSMRTARRARQKRSVKLQAGTNDNAGSSSTTAEVPQGEVGGMSINEKGTQCCLRDEEIEAREKKWEDKFASMRAQLNEVRLENITLKGQLHYHTDSSVSEEGPEHNLLETSSFSSVCGFSDYGRDDEDRCGRGCKVNMSGLPENCSRSALLQMLSDFDVNLEEINFTGVRARRAAIFVNSPKSAHEFVTACHLRTTRGNLLHCRLSRTEDAESSGSLPNDIAPGDLVEIQGLVSDTGMELNGLCGKVVSFDDASGRFAIKMQKPGKTLLMKPENVKLTMKAEEMSESDENFFLDLRP